MSDDKKDPSRKNPFLSLAGDDPVKRAALKHLSEHAKSSWDAAAGEILDSPLGKEYVKMGVHPERVVQFFDARHEWETKGRKGPIPEPKDFAEPVVQPWNAPKPGPKP